MSADAGPHPKRKRNRWGDAQDSQDLESSISLSKVPAASAPPDSAGEDVGKKSRRSRWASAPEETPAQPATSGIAPMMPGMPGTAQMMPGMMPGIMGGMMGGMTAMVGSAETLQQNIILKLQLQQINEKLMTVITDAQLKEQDPERSPSPPPKYDGMGRRTNTREIRMREALNAEKTSIIEQLVKLNPQFQPPADFVRAKPSRKIYIPKQTDQNYNYIGLIIGPRGNTQKQMEAETSTKISIRGKGSAKEGSKSRVGKMSIGDDDDLHVFISGDSEENVEKASNLIMNLLKPVDEELDAHKQKQLRELALINGTLREDEYCSVCGEQGHRQFECPHRAKTFKAIGVKCAICGDLSHPTRDCPLKEDGPATAVSLDNEYDSFMAELSGAPAPKPAATASAANSVDSTRDASVVDPSTAGLGLAPSLGPINANGAAAARYSPRAATVVAPIIDIMSAMRNAGAGNVTSRPQQTVIQVTSVMTGTSLPAHLASVSSSMPSYGAPFPAPALPPLGSAPSAPSAAHSSSSSIPGLPMNGYSYGLSAAPMPPVPSAPVPPPPPMMAVPPAPDAPYMNPYPAAYPSYPAGAMNPHGVPGPPPY